MPVFMVQDLKNIYGKDKLEDLYDYLKLMNYDEI